MGFLLRFAGKACRIVALPSGAPPHGQSPSGPHPTLGASSPGSSPGSEATQIPWRVKTVFHGNYPPSAFRCHSHVQSRDLGYIEVDPNGAPREGVEKGGTRPPPSRHRTGPLSSFAPGCLGRKAARAGSSWARSPETYPHRRRPWNHDPAFPALEGPSRRPIRRGRGPPTAPDRDLQVGFLARSVPTETAAGAAGGRGWGQRPRDAGGPLDQQSDRAGRGGGAPQTASPPGRPRGKGPFRRGFFSRGTGPALAGLNRPWDSPRPWRASAARRRRRSRPPRRERAARA